MYKGSAISPIKIADLNMQRLNFCTTGERGMCCPNCQSFEGLLQESLIAVKQFRRM